MIRLTKRLLTLALPLALLFASFAQARVPTSVHDTTIRVHRVVVTDSSRLSVAGIVKSDSRACKFLRNVSLTRKHHRKEQILDVGFASIPHSAWAVRSDPHAVDGSKFFVETGRQTITRVRLHNGQKRKRRIVCKPDRVPVQLPATDIVINTG